MAIDTRQCIGCGDCVISCQSENHIAEGYCRSWINERVWGIYPDTNLEFRSERCNHCDSAPCVTCCPTDASYIAEGGIVMLDTDKCIGCGACVESCPYNARYFHPIDGSADKCTFCHHLVSKNEIPVCVEVCPTKCMHFGDIEDTGSHISKTLENREYYVLKEEAGTNPHIFYLK